MWPWSEQPNITTLLYSHKQNQTDPSREVPQADDSMRPGSFSAAADLQVDGELLEAAKLQVYWLVLFFRRETSGQGPDQFPSWVFCLRNLRGLSLERYPHTKLPEAICDLTKLEHLHCYGSALTCIPRSIGRLQSLTELDLYCSYNLHYLPMEVLRCPKLTDSRFSTRVLYTNYKNDLPLPPLQPWWRANVQAAPSFGDMGSLLIRLRFGEDSQQSLPLVMVRQYILPFLPWNFCSVCGTKYAHDLGCYTWSRQRVATDTQALLAFCCSVQCAGQVQSQVYFNTEIRANSKLDLHRRSQDVRACKSPMTNKIPKNWLYGAKRIHSPDWEKNHLMPWPINLKAHMAPMEKTRLEKNIPMRVIISGDVREKPSSTSTGVGRLTVGDTILVNAYHTDSSGRKWVRFQESSDQLRWTALRKKNGTVKLVEHEG
mmetsp:Transcript_241/g.317  ORF Transcript_241/g.317 Transcript_241/m.317 type:complete len:429 (-) Transcript_241:307-1593(-)